MKSAQPIWLKRLFMFAGLFLVIIGIPFTINLLCIFPLTVLGAQGDEMLQYGIMSLTLALVTLGAGIVALRHADRSLKNEPSQPLWFPSPILLLAIFIPLLLVGIIFQESGPGTLFFPVIFFAAAALPPLWAVAWMIPQTHELKIVDETENGVQQRGVDANSPILTWRRGLLSFTGGATLSVLIAIVLEILLPVVVFSLIFNWEDDFLNSTHALFRALSNTQIANALTNPSFIFLFLQIAIIAPIAEEFAKPLVTLPLLRDLSRQESFWLGALAGAGFAVLENIIYATAGISLWPGILIVRSFGSALHPFGSGLVAVGWRDVLNHEKDAHANWWRRFGIAVALHAAWNGGSLLVIALGGAGFFGQMPRELDILGVSTAGIALAFLLILGIATLWAGRSYGHNQPFFGAETVEAEETAEYIPSDRVVAIWALACLVIMVPVGIAGLKLWLR